MPDFLITPEVLDKIISASVKGSNQQNIALLLLQSLNDWRSPLNSLEEFSQELQEFLNVGVISAAVLEDALMHLKSETHAWEIESITGIQDALALSACKDLQALIRSLKTSR